MSNSKLYKCVAIYKSALLNKWDDFKYYGYGGGIRGVNFTDTRYAMKDFL